MFLPVLVSYLLVPSQVPINADVHARLVATGGMVKGYYLGSRVSTGMTGLEVERRLGRPDRVFSVESGPSVTYYCYYAEYGVYFALSPAFGARSWSFPEAPMPPNAVVTGVGRFLPSAASGSPSAPR